MDWKEFISLLSYFSDIFMEIYVLIVFVHYAIEVGKANVNWACYLCF